MIRLENITLSYGDRTLLAEVSAEFRAGELTALIGRNGTGKSTLLRAISSLGSLSCGEIYLGGRALSALSAGERSRLVSFVTTERVRISNLRCCDVVSLGRAPYTNWLGRMQRADLDIVMESLERVGMGDYSMRSMDQLSDGECQRVMIARALAQQTPIILLDEPTSFLDLPNRYDLCRLLSALAHDEGKCILFSTHELDLAMSLSDTIALISPPTLHHLPPTELRDSGALEPLFGTMKM